MLSRIGSTRTLLCVLVVCLLALSCARAFNPYEEEDDVVKGSVPETSTLSCSVDPVSGEEKCESLAKVVLEDDVLEEKIAAAEAERERVAAEKAEKRRLINEKYQAEREAKKEEKRQKRQKLEEEAKKNEHVDADKYKNIAEPIKKLKIDYYRFFGVERDAGVLAIRKAANNMALINHPDKCPTTACKETMIILNQARDVLLDEEVRKEYDFLLRFGFRIYDKELYDDMKKMYDAGEDMPNGFSDYDPVDPTSDFTAMNVTEEGALWLLILCGGLTVAMMAWPIIKFWEKSQSVEAKKAAQKKSLLEAQKLGVLAQASNKKKQERYMGDKAAKRFGPNTTGSPSPSPSPRSATTAVTVLACICLLACMVPCAVSASAFGNVDLKISYYDLLDVASNVEQLPLKRA